MSAGHPWGVQPILSDEVVSIGPFASRDIPAMMSWNQDPEAQRWMDWPTEPLPNDEHQAHCRRVIKTWQEEWAAGRRAPFVVRDSATGSAVGSVEVRRTTAGEWSISYVIRPDQRGRGFATRAVRLLCDWAFATLEVAELHLEVAQDNPASRAVADKVGFVDTGRCFESDPTVHYEPEIGRTRTMSRYVLRSTRDVGTARMPDYS